MVHNINISYENVVLRQIEERDLESLRKWRNDPDNTKFLSEIPYITQEMQLLWYEKYLNNNSEIIFAIDEVTKSNQVVGSLALYNFNNNTAEFGKLLIGEPTAHGKHIGENALIASLNVGFDILGLNEIFLHVYEDNKGAFHIYKKVGFESLMKTDKYDKVDFLMSIKREKWKNVKK